jgi:thiol-disulfide isomerase/thioredoxin
MYADLYFHQIQHPDSLPIQSARFPMGKLFLLILLLTASALNAAAQSGRRITTPRSTQTAPIQPPLNPEPEPKPAIAPSELLFLPESLRERQIKTLDSGSFRFADFQGKVVVINLWASWCGPCRREVPEYEKVRKAYAGRDVEFIGLTTEDPRTSSDRVKIFLRDISFGFRLGWADRETARTLMNGKDLIPQTLVIDADGRIVNHWSGYLPRQSGNKLKQTIDQALQTAQ